MGSVISSVFFPELLFEHLPIHSLIEATGGLMAIAIAGILIVEMPRQENAEHYPWMASALAGMGVLDLFHAAVVVSPSLFGFIVQPHLSAEFCLRLCGLARAVWGRASQLPWLILILTIVFGVVSCVFQGWIPAMTEVDKKFTPLARGLNIGGGLGFLVVDAFFVRRFQLRNRHEDWLFAVHTILFGAAGRLCWMPHGGGGIF